MVGLHYLTHYYHSAWFFLSYLDFSIYLDRNDSLLPIQWVQSTGSVLKTLLLIVNCPKINKINF